MHLKTAFITLFPLIAFSCSQKHETPNVSATPIVINAKKSDTVLSTWISHTAHSFQMLELKDSLNALLYWFRKDEQQLKSKPYFFKAFGKVTTWNKNQLAVHTDKYNLYYTIWHDTLFLRDEAGIIEKLVRVSNDTIGRNEF